MSLTNILIVAAVLIFVMGRRLAGRPLQGGRSFTLPLVLLALGVVQLSKLHPDHLALDAALIAVGAIVTVIGGLVRGATIKVYVRDGHLWSRYTWLTIGVWAVVIAARLGQSLLDHALGADTAVLSAALLPSLALSLLAESAVVARRAHAIGAPFAPGRRSAEFATTSRRSSRR